MKGDCEMKNEKYNSTEIDVLKADETDIVTTSDIEAGVETVPLPEVGGTWEVL